MSRGSQVLERKDPWDVLLWLGPQNGVCFWETSLRLAFQTGGIHPLL